MKTREEQIVEMAKAIDDATTLALNTLGSHNNGRGMWYAEKLYDAGYRKQSDTVGEFVEKLKSSDSKPLAWEYGEGYMDCIKNAVSIAKEYGAEVEE